MQLSELSEIHIREARGSIVALTALFPIGGFGALQVPVKGPEDAARADQHRQ